MIKKGKQQMGYELDIDLIEWINFWETWREWARQKPSLKHPIQYIKWYFSEPKPKYEKFIKENSK